MILNYGHKKSQLSEKKNWLNNKLAHLIKYYIGTKTFISEYILHRQQQQIFNIILDLKVKA